MFRYSNPEKAPQLPMTITNGAPSKRRNGLQPACEPCRKAKVRCDYASTASVCSRCRKRQTVDQCIFLDAPMTGQTASLAPRKPRKKDKPRTGSSLETNLNGVNVTSPERGYGSTAGSGFFGSTSFSATIHQASTGLTGLQDDFDDDIHPLTMDSKKGAKVLKQLPNSVICERLLDVYQNNSGEVGFPKAIPKIIFDGLKTMYGDFVDGSPEDVQVMAKTITKNTAAPLVEPEGAQEWIAAFTGANTRWEAIGIMFAGMTYGVLSIGDRDVLFKGSNAEQRKMLNMFKECIETCIDLCRNTLNVLVCALLYKNLLLETVLRGDSALSVWRLNHELVAMTTALGLHCYQPASKVTMHSEMAKKLAANCFWSDKEISMFTGRPPALSRRHYTCPLPLDVSDEALLAGGEALQTEIESLDENGWNTKGMMHNSTLNRMITLVAAIQDEILELFIGDLDELSMDRINAIKKRVIGVYTHVPSILHVTKEMLVQMEDDLQMWRMLFGRLDYLRIHFLLERLSHERSHESKKKLLEVAREMVDLIVYLWLQRDRSAGRHYDYDYVIMCYGMPSTGILCTSILRQTQDPASVPATEKLPVGEVVQSLSLMIGFLEWIKPCAGNYKLCQRMARVVKRVLDSVFEPAQPAAPPEEEAAANGLTWTGMVDEMNDWDWLNSIDWSRGPYIDVPQLPLV